jgi:hypothetical protein
VDISDLFRGRREGGGILTLYPGSADVGMADGDCWTLLVGSRRRRSRSVCWRVAGEEGGNAWKSGEAGHREVVQVCEVKVSIVSIDVVDRCAWWLCREGSGEVEKWSGVEKGRVYLRSEGCL